MSRVETALEELIAAVIASEEYREYDRQKQICLLYTSDAADE